MSKDGSLPDGCVESDLPGNSNRDIFVDEYYDANLDQLLEDFWEKEKEFCKELITNTDKFYLWATDVADKIYREEE